MNKKFTAVVSITIILIFFFAAAYFITSIYSQVSSGKENAPLSFTSFTQTILSFMEQNPEAEDNLYRNIVQYLLTHDDIAAVTITTNDGSHYAFPQYSRYFSVSTDGEKAISVNSPMIKVFSQSAAGSHSTYLITAAVFIMNPETVFKYGRVSFVIILTATLFVLFLLFFMHLQQGSSVSPKSQTFSESYSSPTEDDCVSQPLASGGLITPDSEKISNDDEGCSELPQHCAQEEQQATHYQHDDSDKEDFSVNKLSKASDPLGLFSADTGFGWEQYLEPRLDAELSRAVSSEQDLTLTIIRFSNMNRKESVIQKCIPIILSYFKFRDLVFEYGKDSFAGILINSDLDTSMAVSENLFSEIAVFFNEAGIKNCTAMGLTTRTLRLVPAARMIKEAEQAAEKASQETEMPIVAFRASPEKYRQFIAGESI